MRNKPMLRNLHLLYPQDQALILTVPSGPWNAPSPYPHCTSAPAQRTKCHQRQPECRLPDLQVELVKQQNKLESLTKTTLGIPCLTHVEVSDLDMGSRNPLCC